ncbi:hypothetical protein JKP88DRAFT_255764 [Tribonema minus]|uniref:Uncharacterized protein n=1 Tax=Tribonema minus TaxID=303371 RepID=A0A836CFF0_9STRA|nr:hypothetical protein JKP88DRAFT_255764 [Tribonema minus]
MLRTRLLARVIPSHARATAAVGKALTLADVAPPSPRPNSSKIVAALIPYVQADLVMIEQHITRVDYDTPPKAGHYTVMTPHDGNASSSKGPSSSVAAVEGHDTQPKEQNIADWIYEQVYMGDALYAAHKLQDEPTMRTLLIACGADLFMSLFYYKIDPEITPGEFSAALDTARQANIPVLLGVRPWRETLVRAAQALEAHGIKDSASLLDEESADLSQEELVQEYASTLRKLYIWRSNVMERWMTPRCFSVTVDERDAYMADCTAHCLEQRNSKSTVMVVGAAHLPGIVGYLREKHGFTLVSGHIVLPKSAVRDECVPINVDALEHLAFM